MYITLNNLIALINEGETYYPDKIHSVKFDSENNALIIRDRLTDEKVLQDSFDLKEIDYEARTHSVKSYKEGDFYTYRCSECHYENIITEDHYVYKFLKDNKPIQNYCQNCKTVLDIT